MDDLGLFKAIDAAGLEGRVVVVDTTEFADAVITTIKKRTGKNVNQAVAKRAAAGAGVPCLVLKAVSAERLLEALGPLLDHTSAAAGGAAANKDARWFFQLPQAVQSALDTQHELSAGPRLLRQDEVDMPGSQELLQLLWGSAGKQTASHGNVASSSESSSGISSVTWFSPGWQAWHARQSAATLKELFDVIRATDIEDVRGTMVPVNPNARAGERYRLLMPLRHNSKLRKKRLNQQLAERQADW